MEFMLTSLDNPAHKITFRQVSKEAFEYIKNPRYIAEDTTLSIMPKIRYCAYIFLLQVAALPFLGPLIYLALEMTKAKYMDIDRESWVILSYIVVLGPIVEELIFRGLLRFNRLAISFWMALLLGCAGWFLSPNSTFKNAFVLIALISFPLFYVLTQSIQARLRSVWKNHFVVVFHFVVVVFGLIHLGNYTNVNNYVWALPLVSIQLLLGYFLGFLRMKFGFWYGVGLHILWNFTITLIALSENI